MRGSGISDISASFRSAVSTTVRTGVSSSLAILPTRELFSLLSILVRMSEMLMTLAFQNGGRRNRAPAQCDEQQQQFGLVNVPALRGPFSLVSIDVRQDKGMSGYGRRSGRRRQSRSGADFGTRTNLGADYS